MDEEKTAGSTRFSDAWLSLGVRDFRVYLLSTAFFTLASRALAVVIGFQVYHLSHRPIALGLLGLVEAIPAVGLSLYGGHVSDRADRRNILLATTLVSVACAGLLSLLSEKGVGLFWFYAVIFLAGIARGFADPAGSAFEAQIVPRPLMVNASAWAATVWQTCAIVGPALGGLSYGMFGPAPTYLAIGTSFACSWIAVALVPSRPIPAPDETSVLRSISEGVRYVFRDQVLLGSMALDLFAVLFGGATALFPIFAADILKVGPQGLGLLAAAPSAGSLVALAWAMRRPPKKRAGETLLWSVTGFGVSMIAFGLSRSFALSLVCLAFSGLFDGISVVVRRSILRLMSPEPLRGRIAAVSWIFIGSSNEIGAFESGVVASLIGTVPAVWGGGAVTLLVAAFVARRMPRLRSLSLE